MSFLAEVISSADKIELEQINEKVPVLITRVETCRSEVISFIDQVYSKFTCRPKRNQTSLNNAVKLEEDLTNFKKSAECLAKKELVKSSVELEKHVVNLNKATYALAVVLQVCKIHEALMNFRNLLATKNYVKCMELILNTKKICMEIPNEERSDVVIELMCVVDEQKECLLNEFPNIFRDHIGLSDEGNKCSIKIKKNNEELREAFLALYLNSPDVYYLNVVTKFLWDKVFVPVVDYDVNIVLGEDETYATMTLGLNRTEKGVYLDVFTNLKIVMDFLLKNFNIKLNEDFCTLDYIGRDIRDNLSELLIKHCLQDTIPSTPQGLEKYKVVIEDTKELETVLCRCHIFADDTTSILEYANNVNILFINKKCQEYMELAQAIMKKDLHDLTEVGTPYDPSNPLADSTKFLRCSVSKSTIELLNLAEKIVEEVITSSEVSAGRLFCTLQNSFHIYGSFVPEYHKKLLQTIPQQVALFYNNCIYLAYNLQEMNETYSSKLSPLLKTGPIGFKDEVSQLERIGTEHFSIFVVGQIKQINDIMKGAGLNAQSLDKLEPSTEKCIRQCLRQQELLRTVWQKVLSYTVYNRTIGVILNALCEFLIKAVVHFEDISSSVAEQLIETFKIILTRGPKLFTDSNEICLFVVSWYKFNELNFVLASSLLDIDDRWADGKGPLALQFKPEELRQLIRALFQNTDHRAALLAKI